MAAGNRLKLKLRLSGASSIVPTPVVPEVQAVIWGAKSPAGWGSCSLSYNGVGALEIVSGNSSGLWAISNNRLVTAGTYNNASTTALSYGAGPYVLTITDGVWVTEVTVIVAANTWSVMHDASDTSTANQLRTAMRSAAKGDTISLRDDMVFNPGRGDWRVRRLANTAIANAMTVGVTAVADADWIKVTSDTDKGATICGLTIEGNSQTKQGFWFYRLRFEYLWSGFNISGNLLTLGANTVTSATSYVRVSQCRFRSNTTHDVQLSANELLNGIRGALGAHEVWIHDNLFDGLYAGVNYTGTRTNASFVAIDTNLWTIGNTFRNIWSDGIKSEGAAPHYSRFNFFIDKRYGAGDVHGDFEQRLHNATLPGTYPFGDFIGNILVRGSGTAGFADGQGFYQTCQAEDVSFTGAVVEGNFFLGTMARFVTLTKCVNPVVRFNTGMQDQVDGVSANVPGIFLRSCTGTPVVDFNALAASVGATLEIRNSSGAVEVTGTLPAGTNVVGINDNTARAAAFAAPAYGAANDDFEVILAAWALKASGPLDLSTKVGAIGTGYIDHVARTYSFP